MKAILLEEFSLYQWVLVFFLYSFIGWLWEVSIYIVKERRFVNRGFLTGPFLPIYGCGAVTILVCCLPFKQNVWLVAAAGMLAASLLELVTGWAMESLFHVKYWDYTGQFLNFKGYICLMSAATWAVFSVVLIYVVHPFIQPLVCRIPPVLAWVCAAGLSIYGVVDVVFSVRRAIDMRKILEGLEKYKRELEATHGGLDVISGRIELRVKQLADHVETRQEEVASWLDSYKQARERVEAARRMKSINQEEAMRERFANLEKALADAASLLPDVNHVRGEIDAFREKHEKIREALHADNQRRLRRAKAMLRANPSASSAKHDSVFEQLKKMREDGKNEEND